MQGDFVGYEGMHVFFISEALGPRNSAVSAELSLWRTKARA